MIGTAHRGTALDDSGERHVVHFPRDVHGAAGDADTALSQDTVDTYTHASLRRPFGARGMSSVRYRTRLGDLKNKQPTERVSCMRG